MPCHHLNAVLALALLASAAAAQPSVSWAEETQSLLSASVSAQGANWLIVLTMDDDNGNGSLPNSYRRWWHCRIDGLNPSLSETLNLRVENPGYTDIILPVWSLSPDGVNFAPFERVPLSATPSYSGGRHSFSLQVPPGTSSLRLAKYFPYSVAQKDAFVSGLSGLSAVRSISTLGVSGQGRPIEMIELSDASVPDAGKRRVWIHAGIHPAETTSYWVVEGLINFLVSTDPRAQALLRGIIFDVVPMANPDGVFLGNYRTNASSVNLETQWGSPYNSTQPEIQALRGQIESFMGNPSQAGSNPIEVLINLHSTHGQSWPLHFRHTANSSWNPISNPSGVLPGVNALETAWIDSFKGRSAFVNQGPTLSSSCGSPSRPFVECMMHDRWSANPSWTGSPGLQPQVMAITFEGSYGPGPSSAWNTPADWRQVGEEMALALGDDLGIQSSFSFTSHGIGCPGAPVLSAVVNTVGGVETVFLVVTGAPPSSTAWMVASQTLISLPLPPAGCPLVVWPDLAIPLVTNVFGQASLPVAIPAGVVIDVELQFVAETMPGGAPAFFPSNRLHAQLF